ncbi:carbohydrate porin [Niabella sp.]|uniref:carbohydrate porin n=1 Tax=Niabella sp. TaxID=1962976 RepID=UPI00260C0C75|nr:carbohydrate porin [Niabella sp.]
MALKANLQYNPKNLIMISNPKRFITLCLLALAQLATAQEHPQDSSLPKWTAHFQTTVIAQKHSGFRALYSGMNSLADSVEPTATSLTATLFLGRRLWKGAAIYVNPEVSGGKGLSFAQGVAGALNGETYRVGEVAPQVFIARAYLQQHIPLGNTSYEKVSDDNNQLEDQLPASRITISAGKFAISDFYDANEYSNDPRTQFFNWSLWANGTWDYPANTRGYTEGVVVELIKPRWAVRLSTVAVPRIANYHLMEYRPGKAHSETLELEHQHSINSHKGKISFIISNTHTRAPSYADGMKALAVNDSFLLAVIKGNAENTRYGGKKLELGLNIAQEITHDIGFFSRLGWNDGQYASWAFTEIDHTINAGLSAKGSRWKRPDDVWGLAAGLNGISKPHRDFLKNGGYGFIIGDGRLNYGLEGILETYYNARLTRFLSVTFDYQFIRHPGYNKDRGPVHAFGLRGHIDI